MSKSETEILEVLNGLGSKKLDLDILFSYYSLELSFEIRKVITEKIGMHCLLYTSPSPRDNRTSRMPSSA